MIRCLPSCPGRRGNHFRIAKENLHTFSKLLSVSVLLLALYASADAQPISFGQTLPGSIVSPAQMDNYTFTASAGDIILLRMSRAPGSSVYPGMRLYGPDATLLCEAGNSSTAEISGCTAPTDGTYMVLAFDSWNGTLTGNYAIYLQRLNNPGNGINMGFGQTIGGSIDSVARMDTYTFTANAGDVVLVRMSRAPGSSVYPGVRLYGPDATLLCEAGSSSTAEISGCTVPADGPYTVLAFDSWNGTLTGNYAIYIQRLNNPGNGVNIGFGQTIGGSIDSVARMDTYTFTANAGDVVLVRMSRAPGSSVYPGIRLYGSDASLLCNASHSTTAEISSCGLTNGGTYTVLAFDSWNGTLTGNYNLYLGCISATCGISSLSGSVSPSGSGIIAGEGINCPGVCSADYVSGTTVALSAIANPGFAFSSWTGCDSASGGTCNMNMISDKNVTANFDVCATLASRRAVTVPVYYSSIQEAYNAAADGDTIETQAIVFAEALDINNPANILINIRGGYDCPYSNHIGIAVIDGSLTVSRGTAVIADIVLR